MGQHIQPASAVLTQGIKIDSPAPASWKAARDGHLRPGEALAGITGRLDQTVAIVISGKDDYNQVRADGGDFYIIDEGLVQQAA